MAAQTVDKLGVGSYAQHHFSLIINSFFIFLKKAKNPAVFQPRFSSIFVSFFKAIIGTIICFVPSICYIFLSGQFNGYQPFSILITDDVIASGIPFSILGMALIVLVWGFFEGFNYVVICDKINRRYPTTNEWLDYGAITCAIVCILFHPFSTSFWGIVEIITTVIAIYGMLMVKKKTGNAWGCVFAFCFIWNAI